MQKVIIAVFLSFSLAAAAAAQETRVIELKKPQLTKGKAVMTALNRRQSVRWFDKRELDLQTLSNLMWAATGVNREDGRRTNPTAMNRQEIDVYACLKDGAYLYNPQKHILEQVSAGDCRVLGAPVTLAIVAKEELPNNYHYTDAGYVSQNIYLFAAGMGLATVARGSMPDGLQDTLRIKKGYKIILNHPVGYPNTDK
ncbi:MAG: SagB/ThcOx family dehydrogenase [Elusimicrobiota bacterium]|jgi:nitroreductase|nr:SagB/ThcOx family dehydrogenase [Elusimicrobiota bacterium]